MDTRTNPARETRRREMFSHVEEWQRSGMRQHVYCVKAGLKYSCFQYWRKQYQRMESDNGDFIPVQVSSIEVSRFRKGHEISRAIEITYPDGVHLRLPVSVGIHQLLRLIARR